MNEHKFYEKQPKGEIITKEVLCFRILSNMGAKTDAVTDKDLKRACRKPKAYVLRVYASFIKDKQYDFARALLLK